MIASTKIIFCDQEHGCGNVSFPAIEDLTDGSFIRPSNAADLRRKARLAGWKRTRGQDYCPDCVGCMEDRKGDAA
jgi:hypothetical protein